MQLDKFNLRIYGLLLQDGKILITDELRGGTKMTKFPGGGLEFHETFEECLYREFMEEMDQPINVLEYFFHNENIQPSAFKTNERLISFYYFVELKGRKNFETVEQPFQFKNDEVQCFRWLEIDKISVDDLTYPIDKKVLQLLKDKHI
jgi:8-oxo-dGTP diphosphatase